jgi:hypothetical protein
VSAIAAAPSAAKISKLAATTRRSGAAIWSVRRS